MEAFKGLADQPELQAKAKAIHDAYRSEQEAAGKPLFPEFHRAQAEDFGRVRKMFTDRERHGFDDEQFAEVSQSLADPEKKARFLNEQFLSRQFQRPTSEIRNLGTQYRDEYAKAAWGLPVSSDAEFYQKVGEDFDAEDQIQKAADKIALKGLSSYQNFEAIPEEVRNSPAFKRRSKQLTALFEEQADATAARLSPYRETVRQTVEDIKGAMGGEQSNAAKMVDAAAGSPVFRPVAAAGELANIGDFETLAKRLISIPKEDLDFVLSAIAENANPGEDKKAFAVKMSENFARGARDMALDIPAFGNRAALMQLQAKVKEGGDTWGDTSTVEGYLKGMRMAPESDAFRGEGTVSKPSAEIQAAALDKIETQLEVLDLSNRIRRIGDDVDPATSEHMVTRGLYSAARSIPYTAVAMVPGGTLATSAALAEDSYQTLRRTNPSMSREQAMAVSAISGPIQGALERFSGKILTGRLPTLGRFLNKTIATNGAAVKRAVVRGVESAALEMGQENLQDLTPSVIQAAMAAIDTDMPEANMRERFGEIWDNQGELFFAVLPLALIGAGAGTVSDFTDGRALIASPRHVASIIGNEAAASEIADLAKSGDFEGAQSLLRKGMQEAGADTAPVRETIVKASAEIQSENVAQRAAIERGEAFNMLPVVTPTGDGRSLVRFNDGTERTFDTYTEANEVRFKHASNQSIRFHEDLISTITHIDRTQQVGQGTRFVKDEKFESLLAAKQSGRTSEKYAGQRADEAAADNQATVPTDEEIKAGLKQEYDEAFTAAQLKSFSEDDRLAALTIIGENTTEFENGLYVTTTRLSGGATWATVIEEKMEGDAVNHIRNGRREWLKRSLRDYERAIGFPIFRAGVDDDKLTDGDIKGAYARAGLDYFTGTADEKDGFQRSAKFKKRYDGFVKAGLSGSMESYAQFFSSIAQRADAMQQLRKKGALDPELETELKRSTGFGEQARFEQGVEQDAAALKEEFAGAGFVATDDAPFSVIANNMTPKEWAKTLPDSDFSERMPNDTSEPYSGDFKEGQITAEQYGDDPYVYRDEWINVADFDPRISEDFVGLEGMPFDQVARLPTTQKYIEWYQGGFFGPPITVVQNEISGRGKSTNRRRIVAALEAGIEKIPARVEIGRASELMGKVGNAPFSVIQRGEGYQKTAMPDGMILEGPASFSVIAFHGTPHKVDRFSTDKIGTGEGAQAYGWGLYFAESEGVGRDYKNKLSKLKITLPDSIALSQKAKQRLGELNLFLTQEDDFTKIVSRLRSEQDQARRWAQQGHNAESNQAFVEVTDELINAIKSPESKLVNEGNLYTVELLPNDETLLDWDKPLSEQSEVVRNALKGAYEFEQYFDEPIEVDEANTTGNYYWYYQGDTYDSKREALESGKLVGQLIPVDSKAAAERLLNLGIKGIRYLDGNSRADRTGTYNYVIFDESLVRILEENGQPVTAEPSFSVISNAQDAEYLNLAKDPEANREKLQAMVDDAASKKGYSTDDAHRLQHRAPSLADVSEDGESGVVSLAKLKNSDLVPADYWTRPDWYVSEYTERESHSKIKNAMEGKKIRVYRTIPKTAKDTKIRNGDWVTPSREYAVESGRDENAPVKVISTLARPEQLFWDGNSANELGFDDGKNYAYRNTANNRKLTDIVTYEYDEDGNASVIPLSKRFNFRRSESSFSVISNADSRIADMFNPLLRNPEQRRRIVLEMQRKGAEEGRKFQEIIRFNRTDKDIETERKTREGEIMGDKLDTLSPAEIGALEALGTLDDVGMRPILSDLLREKFYKTKSGKSVRYWRGSLMSKSAAAKEGIPTKGGEWDGIPEGLPPYVWGGSITPDQAASQFGFESPEAFWAALESEVASYQNLKADTKAAMTRIRELEKEAKAESREWAAEQKKLRKTVGTDRATLIAAMRTLQAMVSALPSEIRGKIGGFVQLALFKTPGAMLDELERRVVAMDRELERWLKKEADKGVKKLFEKAKPAKDESGKKPVGKAGADIHDLFNVARQAWKNWDAAKAEAHAVGLESEVAKGDLAPEIEAHKLMEAELVRAFGGWNEADSVRKNHALDTAEEIWTEAYHAYKLKKAAEKERRDGIRAALRADTGKAGKKSERALQEMAGMKLPGKSRDFFLSLLNFEQLTAWAFGKESTWARWFADEQRKAENAKLDAVQSATDGIDAHFTRLAGGNRFAGEKLQYRMMQRTLTATAANGDVVPLSELEALSALLMWQQEDGKRHLRGKRDENGAIISDWAYDEDFIDEISGKLSTEAWATLGFLQSEYGQEYEPLNAVYRDLYGINLPKNPNYSPLTVKPTQAPGGQTQDPLTGSTASAGSFTPGSLRSRAQVSAEPDFRDAVATYLAHKKQIEHWKANAKFITEANAVLGNREVGNSIEAAHGQEAVKILRKWLDAIAQGGVRDAAAGTTLMKLLEKVTGNAASMALVGRAGTLAIQSTQLGAAAAKMPTGAYVVRLGKLLSGNLGWGAALKSEYIQRRLAQQPVMVQAAMEGLRAGKPTQLKHQVRKIGQLINGADALFTAGTYAMVHDYQYSQAIKGGMTPAEADIYATQEAERIVDDVAQPSRMGTRSYFEVSSSNPIARLAWAFASDARKNAALVGFNASKGSNGDTARAILFVVVINGFMGSIIRNAWRDARGDDDDEIFDERYWSPKRMALTTSTDWLFGFPIIGEEIQRALYSVAGEYTPDSGLLSAISQAPGAAKSIVEGDSTNFLRDVEKIMTAAGLFSDNTAAATSVMHILRDLYGLGKNFLSE